ncbi:MAG: hypothetical protein KatS3mg126_2012 [Lysobacteraceae bacterium]|nr:MAG: hypothetical protein KatS3mg126_2012 [Xanthomonadaceae bacterium]
MMNPPAMPFALAPNPRPHAGNGPASSPPSADGTVFDLLTLRLDAEVLPVAPAPVGPAAPDDPSQPPADPADGAAQDPVLAAWMQMLVLPSLLPQGEASGSSPPAVGPTEAALRAVTRAPHPGVPEAGAAPMAQVHSGIAGDLAGLGAADALPPGSGLVPAQERSPLPAWQDLLSARLAAPSGEGPDARERASEDPIPMAMPRAAVEARAGAGSGAAPPLPAEAMVLALAARTRVETDAGSRELATPTPTAHPGTTSAHAERAVSLPPLQVALPPGSAPQLDRAFHDGMAVRLHWMVQQNVGRAEIRLEPADLGSIEVRLELDGKSVRADFHAATPEVRHLIETGLPRLRDLLDAQGLQLQHADVGHGQGRQSGREPSGEAPRHGLLHAEPERPAASPAPRRPSPGHDGTLSEYA